MASLWWSPCIPNMLQPCSLLFRVPILLPAPSAPTFAPDTLAPPGCHQSWDLGESLLAVWMTFRMLAGGEDSPSPLLAPSQINQGRNHKRRALGHPTPTVCLPSPSAKPTCLQQFAPLRRRKTSEAMEIMWDNCRVDCFENNSSTAKIRLGIST